MLWQTCQISLGDHLFHNVEVKELVLGLEVSASILFVFACLISIIFFLDYSGGIFFNHFSIFEGNLIKLDS